MNIRSDINSYIISQADQPVVNFVWCKHLYFKISLLRMEIYMVVGLSHKITNLRYTPRNTTYLQRSPSEALELLGCSALSPDPPGLLLPLSQLGKQSENNLLS